MSISRTYQCIARIGYSNASTAKPSTLRNCLSLITVLSLSHAHGDIADVDVVVVVVVAAALAVDSLRALIIPPKRRRNVEPTSTEERKTESR